MSTVNKGSAPDGNGGLVGMSKRIGVPMAALMNKGFHRMTEKERLTQLNRWYDLTNDHIAELTELAVAIRAEVNFMMGD